jgi:hypothetical protein
VRLEGLGTLKQFSDLIGTRTRDLPACSIAPQLSALSRARFMLALHRICLFSVSFYFVSALIL